MSQAHNNNKNIGTKMEREILEILRELSQRTASLETLMSAQVDRLREGINNNSEELEGLDRYIKQMREDFNKDVKDTKEDIEKLEKILKEDIEAVEEVLEDKLKTVDEQLNGYKEKQFKIITFGGMFIAFAVFVIKYGDIIVKALS